ncbi:hypothetical protein SH139x_000790 [Planctomycetaceae bacterium SH139]
MPIKSLSLACAAAMLYTSIAGAQMDLGSLLNSIGYGNDDPPSVENLPPPADASAPADELAAASTSPEFAADEFTDEPLLIPPSFEAPASPSQELSPSANVNNAGGPPQPPMLPMPLEDNPLDDLRMVPQAGNSQLSPQPLSDFSGASPSLDPQFAPAPSAQAIDRVDLDSLTGLPGSEPPLNQQACQQGCRHHCQQGCQQSCQHACQRGCAGSHQGCGRCSGKGMKIARCLDAPNLPPPASSEMYFKSPKVFNDLWGTYAAEKAKESELMHKHIHGTCDCAEKSARERAWKAGLCIPGRATSGVSLPH